MNDALTDRPDHASFTPDPPEVDVLAAELVRRLRPVLGSMPETEFLHLARAIARRRHRWDLQERTQGP